jgi:hypothetical protein
MERSLRQRLTSHRSTQSGFRFAGSAICGQCHADRQVHEPSGPLPATRVAPRYLLFSVWRLWQGTSFEMPCRSNCSGRGWEGLPPHCRLPRKTTHTLTNIVSVSIHYVHRSEKSPRTERFMNRQVHYVPLKGGTLKEGPLLRCEASACRVLFSRSTQYCNSSCGV